MHSPSGVHSSSGPQSSAPTACASGEKLWVVGSQCQHGPQCFLNKSCGSAGPRPAAMRSEPGSALAPNPNLHWPREICSLYPGDSQAPTLPNLCTTQRLFRLQSLMGSWKVASGLRCPGPFADLPQARYWRQSASVPTVASTSRLQVRHTQAHLGNTPGWLCSSCQIALNGQRQQLTLACSGAPSKGPQNQHTWRLAPDHNEQLLTAFSNDTQKW